MPSDVECLDYAVLTREFNEFAEALNKDPVMARLNAIAAAIMADARLLLREYRKALRTLSCRIAHIVSMGGGPSYVTKPSWASFVASAADLTRLVVLVLDQQATRLVVLPQLCPRMVVVVFPTRPGYKKDVFEDLRGALDLGDAGWRGRVSDVVASTNAMLEAAEVIADMDPRNAAARCETERRASDAALSAANASVRHAFASSGTRGQCRVGHPAR